MVVLLNTSPETAAARKPEIEPQEVERQMQMFDTLMAGRARCFRLENNGSVADAAEQVVRWMADSMASVFKSRTEKHATRSPPLMSA